MEGRVYNKIDFKSFASIIYKVKDYVINTFESEKRMQLFQKWLELIIKQ